MKDDNGTITSQVEKNVITVLQAEKDAEQAVRDCEREVKQSISDAQITAQSIITRTDQRISDMEMRHSHKMHQLISDIEKQGVEVLNSETGGGYEKHKLASLIKALATELCLGYADDRSDT